MKRSMILACALAVGLMLSVNLNTSIASSDSIIPTKRKAASMPAQRVAPVGKTSTSTLKAVIIKAAITDLQIGTGPTGGWFWQATVKNTGNTSINGRDFTVQGLKKSFPAPQNNWTPASGSIISTTVIAPNQSVVVKRNWTRCCQTDQLKVDLRRASNNTVMDTKLLTNLLKNPAQNIPVDVRVKRIDWDSNTKKWRATLKNLSPYTVKITVQGVLWPQGATSPLPAGGHMITVGANAEATTMWLSGGTNAQNGDMLQVHKKFIMGSCNESNEDCGYKGSNNITIPNSRSF